MDYFSRYPEVIKLSSTTSSSVIAALKTVFARHGIPETLQSDNGRPQYSSQEFAQMYGFNHVTSSPRYPQSNGQVERMVLIVKRMLQKSNDPHVALLSYRSTPDPSCGKSPAELSMGRTIRSTVTQTLAKLVPQWPFLQEFKQRNAVFKEKQKRQFDRRHRVVEQDDLPDGAEVWITSESNLIPGTVVSPGETPRSHVVETPTGVRRNRIHLNVAPEMSSEAQESSPTASPPKVIMTQSKTGTTVHPPDRLG